MINFRTFLSFCCVITLVTQGWIYVKNIFGRIEKYVLMIILIVNAFVWSLFFALDQFQKADNYWLLHIFHFDFPFVQVFEWIFIPVILVFLLI